MSTYVSAISALSARSDESRVADAAMTGDRAAVRTLITKGEDVNAAQGDGMTALHWAAREGNVELIRLLLAAGANTRATTRLGNYTPLLMASRMGHAAAIDALVAGGSDLKATTESGVTALMFAAASGQPDAVRTLVAHGADVNAKEKSRGETALMFAAAERRLDTLKALLAAGADVNVASAAVNLKAAPLSPEEEAFLRAQTGGGRQGGRRGAPVGIPGVTRQYTLAELVGAQGGLTALHFAARQGDLAAVEALVAAGANVNLPTPSDHTTPLLIAVINGQFDLAAWLLDHGADPRIPSDNGVTPLYATLNVEWAPKTLYPQPRAYLQQKLTYLDFMKRLLDRGVDVNARLRRKVWYSEYNFPLLGVDEVGATPFWRAAYASDVDAMKLLVSYGADPNIPTIKPAGRPRTGDAAGRETIEDVSGVPPVPVGGPGIPPLQAAAGAGYGEGFAANAHRNAPSGFLPAVKYLVDELHADVNARDHEGNTALHCAAARGDNEMIEYLVSKGADVKAVNRAGETTADMANSPVSRVEPFPSTIALLEKLGSKNNHRCHSCS